MLDHAYYYIQMFLTVARAFANFFVAFMFLFLGFCISFAILFQTRPAFETILPSVFVKVSSCKYIKAKILLKFFYLVGTRKLEVMEPIT